MEELLLGLFLAVLGGVVGVWIIVAILGMED